MTDENLMKLTAEEAVKSFIETLSDEDKEDEGLAWDLYWVAVDALMVMGFSEKEADVPAVAAADYGMELLQKAD